MGGRVAEELTQSDITTGAGNDIERATEMARRMVCEWGMSDLGPLSFGAKEEPLFLGRDFTQRAEYSEDTAIRIDREVERIVRTAYEAATSVLSDHRDVLEQLALQLLERESLEGREVYDLVKEMTGFDFAPKAPPPSSPPEREKAKESLETSSASPAAPGPGDHTDAGTGEATAEDAKEEPEVATSAKREAAADPAPGHD